MSKETELREELAKLAHEQWSGWMDYLFSKCIDYKPDTIQAEAGAVIIPKWAVDRWRGQSKTIYSDLTVAEMDSDRTEADKFLAVFNTRHPDKELVEQIDRFWEALRLSYEVESREEIEKDCKDSWSKGTSPLEVALHFIWKREPKVKELAYALKELYAVVKGECPSLLDEDSGGDARLDMQIIKALAKYKEKP